MSKVLVYKVVTANSERDLEDGVKARLKAGFEPLGGVSISMSHGYGCTKYCQAMVVYQHEEITITEGLPHFP